MKGLKNHIAEGVGTGNGEELGWFCVCCVIRQPHLLFRAHVAI